MIEKEIDLLQIWKSLKKYLFLILMISVLVSVLVFFAKKYLLAKSYESTVTFVVTNDSQEVNDKSYMKEAQLDPNEVKLNQLKLNQELVKNYIEAIKTNAVFEKVVKNLDLNISADNLAKKIDVKPLTGTAMFTMKVVDSDAGRSFKIANEVTKVFLEDVVKVIKSENVKVYEAAKEPNKPESAGLIKITIFAGILTFFVLAVFFTFREILDRRIKTAEDFSFYFDYPVLVNIPKKGEKTERNKYFENISKYEEAFRFLRTKLLCLDNADKIKSIAIVSAKTGEGRSSVAFDLAKSFANNDFKTLLVDSDLRNPKLHMFMGLDNNIGLSDLLSNRISYEGLLLSDKKIKNLFMLPAGAHILNNTELLSSIVFKDLILDLKKEYDMVIFDTPAADLVSDSMVCSSLTDGAVFVIKSGNTSIDLLAKTFINFEAVGANILGTVMTNLED